MTAQGHDRGHYQAEEKGIEKDLSGRIYQDSMDDIGEKLEGDQNG